MTYPTGDSKQNADLTNDLFQVSGQNEAIQTRKLQIKSAHGSHNLTISNSCKHSWSCINPKQPWLPPLPPPSHSTTKPSFNNFFRAIADCFIIFMLIPLFLGRGIG